MKARGADRRGNVAAFESTADDAALDLTLADDAPAPLDLVLADMDRDGAFGEALDPAPLDLVLADVDRDGAIGEALGVLHPSTRAGFLRGALLGGAALLTASATPATARAASSSRDRAILNYALTLEYVQDSFYSEVERLGALTGALAKQARIVGGHERAHVKAFRDVLGAHAVKRPRFDFRGATEDASRFRRTAVAFEDLAVAAYKAQAPLIHSRAYLGPALAIHAVEARHAAWIRRLAGVSPAAHAFDDPRSKRSTLAIVDATHFVVDTHSTRPPRFTG